MSHRENTGLTGSGWLLRLVTASIIIAMLLGMCSCGKKDEQTSAGPEGPPPGAVTVTEDELDDLWLQYQDEIEDYFGPPDEVIQKDGRDVWFYYHRVTDDKGGYRSVSFQFYTREDLIKYYESMDLDLEDQELDRIALAHTLIRGKDELRKAFGLE